MLCIQACVGEAAALFEFMPHVLTTTHDLLIGHIFLQSTSLPIVPPNTVAIVVYSSVDMGREAGAQRLHAGVHCGLNVQQRL